METVEGKLVDCFPLLDICCDFGIFRVSTKWSDWLEGAPSTGIRVEYVKYKSGVCIYGRSKRVNDYPISIVY